MNTKKEIVKKVTSGERLVRDICTGLVKNHNVRPEALETIIYYAYLAGRGLK